MTTDLAITTFSLMTFKPYSTPPRQNVMSPPLLPHGERIPFSQACVYKTEFHFSTT